MERYIAVDPGKFGCKVAMYDKETNKVKKMIFRTRTCPGDFRDDALEKSTFIMEYNGVVYKVGNGARGDGAELNTSKFSDEHKISMLTAVALMCSSDEVDDVNIAIGLPAKEWSIVDKREEYKSYMFPAGVIDIKIKKDAASEPKEKKFRFKNKFVFPESIGALFMDDSPSPDNNSYIGVLDIGSLNLNATLWNGVELQQDGSITDECGGNILIQELSQELSAEFSRCDERYVAQVLKRPPEERYLRPKNGDQEVMRKSKEMIDLHLLNFAKRIKRCCDGRKWSIDFMDIAVIGGTAQIIKDQLEIVFGESIYVLKNGTFCNVLGYLRIMCSRLPEINDIIPIGADGA